jgi:hypothetical protein
MAVNELMKPPAVAKAQNATELIRAWIVDNGLQCSLNVGVFGENDAIEKEKGAPAEQTLAQIAASFNHEIRTPTAETKGKFV